MFYFGKSLDYSLAWNGLFYFSLFHIINTQMIFLKDCNSTFKINLQSSNQLLTKSNVLSDFLANFLRITIIGLDLKSKSLTHEFQNELWFGITLLSSLFERYLQNVESEKGHSHKLLMNWYRKSRFFEYICLSWGRYPSK